MVTNIIFNFLDFVFLIKLKITYIILLTILFDYESDKFMENPFTKWVKYFSISAIIINLDIINL